MVNPSAKSEYMAPRLTPLITCWISTSWNVIGRYLPSDSKRDAAEPSAGGRLRRHADVLVLVDYVVVLKLRVVLDLEDADHPAVDVAVLVERHLALERLDLRSLDRVADVGVID